MRPSVASSKVQSIKCDGSAGNRTPVFNVRTVQISSSFSSHHTTHYIINILTDSNRDTFLLPGLCLSPLTHNLSCEREIVLSGACYMLWTFRCVHTAALNDRSRQVEACRSLRREVLEPPRDSGPVPYPRGYESPWKPLPLMTAVMIVAVWPELIPVCRGELPMGLGGVEPPTFRMSSGHSPTELKALQMRQVQRWYLVRRTSREE